MKQSKMSLLLYIIIGLAAVGLVSQLLGNTINFLTDILMMVAFAAVIFGLVYFFVMRKRGNGQTDEMKKYKKAVKQSKSKYKQPSKVKPANNKPAKISASRKKKRAKKATHLKVIEGNKPNKKDRASF